MTQGYYIKPAAAAEGIWFIFDPTGALIGSCSSREHALGIVALVNGRASTPQADAREAHEERSATVRVSPLVNRPEEATPSQLSRQATTVVKPVAQRTAMFNWYQPPRRASLRSFLQKLFQ